MRRKGFVGNVRIGKVRLALYELGKKEEREISVKEAVAAMEPFILHNVLSGAPGVTVAQAREALLTWMCRYGEGALFGRARMPVSQWFPTLVKETIRVHQEEKTLRRRRGRKRFRALPLPA